MTLIRSTWFLATPRRPPLLALARIPRVVPARASSNFSDQVRVPYCGTRQRDARCAGLLGSLKKGGTEQ